MHLTLCTYLDAQISASEGTLRRHPLGLCVVLRGDAGLSPPDSHKAAQPSNTGPRWLPHYAASTSHRWTGCWSSWTAAAAAS